MNITRFPFAVVMVSSIVLLAACEPEPEVVGELADPDAPTANELADVELPASERDTAIYRCADNSVVYVTYFTNDTQVAVSSESNGAQTYLPNADAAASMEDAAGGNEIAGEPTDASGPVTFSGEGYTLVGTGDTIEYGTPGGSPQTCRS